jgi:transcriptional regulator GlxA family with amidase domain
VINGFLRSPVALSVVEVRENFRLLTLTALEAFPQPEFSLLDSPGTGVAPLPATLRRAIEFIEANADRHVAVGEIAEFARLSRRGLQSAFHRHLGTTPSAFLRDVRLTRAHQELAVADRSSGASVAAIATRWGFPHQGRFAAAYRKKFGEPPSDTLSS